MIKTVTQHYKPLYYDSAFKAIFASKEYENILKKFLESYLKIKIEHPRMLNAEISIKKIRDQKKTMDLLIEIENKAINIELIALKNNNLLKGISHIYFLFTLKIFKTI